MDGLVTDGYVIPGGPVSNGERALLIVEATDEHEVRTRLAEDPWAPVRLLQAGMIEPWAIWLDGRAGTRRL